MDRNMPKIIARYLPQFHRVKENDQWWGEGFTEWTSVRMGKKLFTGHNQPRVPLNDNYYDLLDKNVMRWQAELAIKYHISGFSFYHYWFEENRKILEKPVENLLNWKDIDMPFCFCWANDSWARTWSNLSGANTWSEKLEPTQKKGDGILLKQGYGDKTDWRKHIAYLLPFFQDSRYIKQDGRPVFIIYKPLDIKCYNEMITEWNIYLRENGFSKGLFVIAEVMAEAFGRRVKERKLIHDALLLRCNNFIISQNVGLELNNGISTYDNQLYWDYFLKHDWPELGKYYYSPSTDFDDTPRRGKNGRVFINISPERFGENFGKLMEKAERNNHEFIFINAWNEWGEGSYLEPDKRWGYKFLQEIKEVVEKKELKSVENNHHALMLSIIIPVYNREEYIRECLDSILCQSYLQYEIICVNDGSTDGTANVLAEYASRDSRVKTFYKENGGGSAGSARNYGIRKASGKYIFFIDSDDMISTKTSIENIMKQAVDNNLDGIFFDGKSFFMNQENIKNRTYFESAYQRKGSYGIFENGYDLFVDLINHDEYTVSPCLYFIKREILISNRILFRENGIFEDNDFTFCVMMLARKVAHTNEVVLRRRVHNNSLMQSKYQTMKNLYGYYCSWKNVVLFWMKQELPAFVNPSIEKLLGGMEYYMKKIYQKLDPKDLENIRMIPAKNRYFFKFTLSILSSVPIKNNIVYVVPYHAYKRNSEIVIYGAGEVGQEFCYQIENNRYWKLVGIVDKEGEKRSFSNHVVYSIEALFQWRYDGILIAIRDKKIAGEVQKNLVSMGISEKIIFWDGNNYERGQYIENYGLKVLSFMDWM